MRAASAASASSSPAARVRARGPTHSLAQPRDSVTDDPIPLRRCVHVFRARRGILDALEVRSPVLVADAVVEREVLLRGRPARAVNRRPRLPQVRADMSADPPRRIREEARPCVRIELVNRSQEADGSFLDEVLEPFGAAAMLPRTTEHEREVVKDELPLRGDVAGASTNRTGMLLSERKRRKRLERPDERRKFVRFVLRFRHVAPSGMSGHASVIMRTCPATHARRTPWRNGRQFGWDRDSRCPQRGTTRRRGMCCNPTTVDGMVTT